MAKTPEYNKSTFDPTGKRYRDYLKRHNETETDTMWWRIDPAMYYKVKNHEQ